MRYLLAILLVGCSCPDLCRGPYQDDLDWCDALYDPSRDWAFNKACRAYAKQEYEECVSDCRFPDLSGDCDDGTDVYGYICTPS